MSDFYLCLLLAGFCAFAHCHHVPGHHEGHGHHPPTEGPSNLPSLKIASASADFAFRFYHEVASEAPGKNIFFSPLSISSAFATILLGARSTTQSQLLAGLGFNKREIGVQEIPDGFLNLLHMLNRSDAEMELSIGNALFTDDKLKPLKKFLDDARHFYQAEICPTDFSNSTEAVEKINSYIDKKTHGKLLDVIKDVDREAAMVLVNYMFLEASWENPFNPEYTKEDNFFVDEETTVKVPMMNQGGMFMSYYDENLSCEVVQLPYKGNASALFILPNQGELKQVEDALGRDVLLKWMNLLRPRRIDLYLPRFSISGSYNLKGKLGRMGITDVFTDLANLSGISGAPKLKVSEAIHKASLNVQENGTEVAATTVVEIVPRSLTITINFNRPLFLIIGEANNESIFFMGKLVNPVEN